MIGAIATYLYATCLLVLQMLATLTTPFPPVDLRTGRDSFVEKANVLLASNSTDWFTVWQHHMGVTPIGNNPNAAFPTIETPPEVDFKSNEVLVVFGGLANCGGYEVAESEITQNKLRVRLRPLSLSLNGGRSPTSLLANPYAFIVYPREQLPIEVQVPTPDANGRLQWKTVAQLTPPTKSDKQ